MKTYKQLPIPKDSIWDRKTYNPYTLLRWWLYDKIRHTKFYDFLEKFIFDPISNCDAGFRNLWHWFPIIWKDRNWDYYYVYEILKQKLIFQRHRLITNNTHTYVWQQNRDITICLNLIERLQQDYYKLEIYDYCESNMRFEKIEEKQYKGEDLYEMKEDKIWENFDPYFNKYKHSLREFEVKGVNGRIRKDYSRDNKSVAIWVGVINHNKAKRLLFKILDERIEGWWD